MAYLKFEGLIDASIGQLHLDSIKYNYSFNELVGTDNNKLLLPLGDKITQAIENIIEESNKQ